MKNNYDSMASSKLTWLKDEVGDLLFKRTSSKSRVSWLAIFLLLFSLSISQRTWSQSLANYDISNNISGSLALDKDGNPIDMLTGTTELSLGSATLPNSVFHDDNATAVTNLPFNFIFMGKNHDRFSVNSNGQMKLGNANDTSAISGTNISGPSANVTHLAPFSGDNVLISSGKVHYKTFGSAPNRVFVFEWIDLRIPYAGSPADGIGSRMQIRLYETANIVEYVYGYMYNNSTSTTTKSVGISSSNTTTTSGYFANLNTTSPTFTLSSSWTNTTMTADSQITALSSTTDGNRRVFRFTPLFTTVNSPSDIVFSNVTATTTTLNWTDNSSNESGFTVTRATDAAFTQNVVNTNVAAGVTTLAVTALTPGTTYYYRVSAFVEGGISSPVSASQATSAAPTYYWVGGADTSFGTAGNWNTSADGSGSARTAASNMDILIFSQDATVTVPAAVTVGQLKFINGADVILTGAGGNRTITISGSPGDDLLIDSTSSLTLNGGGSAAVGISFTGNGNTGLIAGTYNVSPTSANVTNTSNLITTTGGTGTIVTVTGTVNNSLVAASGCLSGSAATLIFADGSNYTHTGFTTSNGYIPTATWAATSNVFITGGTSTTTITGISQSFGNFTYNSGTNTATLSAFTSNTSPVIKGDLNILNTHTGRFRALTSGTLNVLGNLNISGGIFEVASSTGTLNVGGNVTLSGGTLNIAQGGTSNFNVAGNFIQTAGTILQTSTTGLLTFNGTASQNVSLLNGSHGTNAINFRINNAAGVSLTNDISARNVTVSNGNFTGLGNFVYGATSILTYNGTAGSQTISSNEFPAISSPYSLVINNTSANDAIVNMNFDRSLNGVLTLTRGILAIEDNALTLTNTATTAISGGSANSYINGKIERFIANSLTGTTNYVFPIGNNSYNPYTLVNPITSEGNPIKVGVSLIDSPAGVATGALGSINPSRAWSVTVNDDTNSFVSSIIRLTANTEGSNAIGYSNDGGLTYSLLGGTNAVVTANDITSSAPAATSLEGHYVMATKADPPVLSDIVVMPEGNQCTNVSRDISIVVTPGAFAVDYVNLNYKINGVDQSAIAMSNTSGTTWTATIPTVSPVNANVEWYITAVDINNISSTSSVSSYKDEPNLGMSFVVTSTKNAICIGESLELSVNSSPVVGNATLGAGNLTTSSSGTSLANNVSPFTHYYGGFKQQILITASELNALGMTVGHISSLSFDVSSAGTTYTDFTVSLAQTNLTALTTSYVTSGLVQVYKNNLNVSSTGILSLPFGTGSGSNDKFNWDGSSNLIVTICWSNNNGGGTAAEVRYNSTTYVSVIYSRTDNVTPAVMCATLTGSTISMRPKLGFGYTNILTPNIVEWTDGTNTVGTTATLSVSPSTTTTYSAVVTENGCILNSNAVTVTVNPLPVAPVATNSTQCGLQVPTASVTDSNGFTGAIYNWYASNDATEALQSGTSNTFTTAISETTTMYVSVTNPDTLCESTRTAITITVDTPNEIVVTPGATATVCQNGTITLGASSDSDYSYTWTASPEDGSGITGSLPGNTVNVTPTGIGPYVYTVYGSDGSCANSATISLTITPAPEVIITGVQPICPGSSVTLTANTNVIQAGSVTLGSGSTTSSSTNASFLPGSWGGAKTEYIVKASELQAIGLKAGLITSLGFDVTLVGQTYQGFKVQIGHTTADVATTTFSNVPMTQVYQGTLANAGFLPSVGINTLNFGTGTGSSSFNWDGESNIVISICWSSVPAAATSTSTTMRVNPTGFNSTNYKQIDRATPENMCSETSATSVGTNRPKFIFNGQVLSLGEGTLQYSWNDVANTTGNVLTVSPEETTNYTVYGFDAVSGCTGNITATVVVNMPPTAPTATASTQCGAGIPTATVADTNNFAAPIYKWYASEDAPTALQTGASNKYNTSISETTTFYVSVTSADAGCDSERVAVTVTVFTPATITASASQASICIGGNSVLTASGASTYTWTSNPTGFTSTDAVITVAPTVNTTYSVVGIDENGCTTNSVSVPISILSTPAEPTILVSAETVCSGGLVQLSTTEGGTSENAEFVFGTNLQNWGTLSRTITLSGIPSTANVTSARLEYSGVQSINGSYRSEISMATTGAYTLAQTQISTETSQGSVPDGFIDLVGFNAKTGNIVLVISENYDDEDWDYGDVVDATFGSVKLIVNYEVAGIAYEWQASSGTTLYSDASATTVYAGESLTTVYAKPTTATEFSLVAGFAGCYSPVATTTVNVNELPSFTVAPITICEGDTGALTAISSDSYTYTWVPVGGGDSQSGTSVFVNPAVTTTYNVTATTTTVVPACQATQQVVVTVNDRGAIINATTTRVVSPGQVTTFEVVTEGSNLTYQWQVNNGSGWEDVSNDYVDEFTGNYSGVTSSVLTVNNITFDFDNYQYRCLVTGASPCSSLNPVEATLTVSQIGFASQPQSVNLCTQTETQFSIVTTGDEPYFVQWQMSTDGVNFIDLVDGFDSETGLTFSGVNDMEPKVLTVSGINTSHDGYIFKSQLDFFLDSNVATLSVNEPIAFISNVSTTPINVCQATASNQTLSFVAQGSYSSISWMVSSSEFGTYTALTNSTINGITYSGVTTNSLNIVTSASSSVGSYFYKAVLAGQGTGFDKCSDLESNVASLNIHNPLVTIVSTANSYCTPGDAVVLTASGASTYQWSNGSTETSAMISVSPTESTVYTVVGTDEYGCTNTATKTIGVGPSYNLNLLASETKVCPGSESTLSAQMVNAGDVIVLQESFETFPSTMFGIIGTNVTASSETDLYKEGSKSVKLTYSASSSTGAYAMTSNINLSSYGTAQLKFSHICATETGWDYGRLQYSINNGTTWINMPTSTYTGSAVLKNGFVNFDKSSYTDWNTALTSTSSVVDNTLWKDEVIDLSSFASNSQFRIRFLITSDTGVQYQGWFIDNVQIVAKPGITSYTWSSTPEGFTSTSASAVVNPTVPTTYTLNTTSNSGCVAQASIFIDVETETPIIVEQPASIESCTGYTATFNVDYESAVPVQIQWRKDGVNLEDGGSISGATSASLVIENITTDNAGIYDVVLTSCGSLNTTSNTAALTVNESPVVAMSASSNLYCSPSTEEVVLTATGAETYTWSPVEGLSATTGSVVTAMPSATTTYTVTGTSTNGCTATAQQTIVVNVGIDATITNVNGTQCAGSPTNLEVNVTPNTYNITTAGQGVNYGFTSSIGEFVPLTNATNTTIPNTGDSENSSIISFGDAFVFNYGGTNYTQLRVSSDGQLIFGSNGTQSLTNNLSSTTTTHRPGVTALWDDLQATQGVKYKLEGTAPNRVFTVEWLNMEWNYNSGTPVISFQVKLYETTNSIEFIYRQESTLVNSGSASIGLMGTASSNFVSLQDVSENPQISTLVSQNLISTKPATGQIYRFVPMSYTYSWTSSPEGFTASTKDITVSPTEETTYTLVVLSSQGCSASSSIVVEVEGENPIITSQPENQLGCLGKEVTFEVVTPNTSGVVYQWRKNGVNLENGGNIAGANTASLIISDLSLDDEGNYDVVLSTCGTLTTTSDVATLEVNDNPSVSVSANATIYCNPGGSPIELSARGAQSYTWTPATGLSATEGSTVSASPSVTTVYTVTGTDANGCNNTASIEVKVERAIQNLVASASSTSSCEGAPVNLSATATQLTGVANYAFSVSQGSFTPITDGTVIATGASSTSSNDNWVSSGITIPSFTLNGVSYTTAYITSNGFITLGGSAPSNSTYTSISSTTGSGIAIAPFSADLNAVNNNSNSDITWLNVGNEIVFQWRNYRRYNHDESFDMQARLNRISGEIIFVYKLNSGPANSTQYQPQVGIRTSLTDFKNISVGVGNENWNTPITGLTNSSTVRFNSASPAKSFTTGLTYTFTPPTPMTFVWSSPNVVNANSANTATLVLTEGETFEVTATRGACSATAQVTVNVLPNVTWYRDADGDGFGDINLTISNCTQPVGYVANADDCDDTKSLINPNAIEICWNNIDDNCDGQKSEGCAPIVVNMATANNFVLPNFSFNPSANSYTYSGVGTKTYRFKITNLMTNEVREVYSESRFVSIPGDIRNYNSSYTVTAAAVINGEDVPYAGNTITVHGPSISLINISSVTCGSTLSTMNGTISANAGLQATSYMFRLRLTSDNGPSPTYYYVQSTSRFVTLGSFIGFVPQYSTSYTVDVQYELFDVINNALIMSGYGSSCEFNTPGMPTAMISQPTCGTRVANLNATISSNPVSQALLYEFRIRQTNDIGENPTYYTTVANSSRFSTLGSFQGLSVQYNTSYTISVRYMVMQNGVEVWSNFGSECEIESPLFPVTEISPSICGNPNIGLDENISIVTYPGFPTYRITLFEQIGDDLVPVSTITRNVANFKLSMFDDVETGKNYTLAVSIQIGGVFGPDGKGCDIGTFVPSSRNPIIPFTAVAYPNPYTNEFMIDVKSSDKLTPVDIKVYDMIGRLVEQRVSNVADMENTTLGERYPSGVYNVVVTQDEQTRTVRVVKR
jgi:hypothetical protein